MACGKSGEVFQRDSSQQILVAARTIGQNMSIYPNSVMKVGHETYVTVDDETTRLCEWSRQYDNSVTG